MNVILDTNIYIQDFLMNSASSGLLLDYLKKTDSKILMPLIVWQELGEKYRSEFSMRLAAYEAARKSLQRVLSDTTLPCLEPDVSSEVAKYLEFVRRKLNLRDEDIIPYRESYLSELVTRAVRRLKPFSDKGEEFRDALLWLTVLDIARGADEEALAFISNDMRAFGQNHQLYEALCEEGKATGTQVNYYNSISKFIESHATQVEYITRSWLFNAIHIDGFEDAITQRLTEYVEHLDEYDLRQRGWEGLGFTGYLGPTGPFTEENLTEYFVYEKSDGSLYVQVNYYVEYEIEFILRNRARERRLQERLWEFYDSYPDYDDDPTLGKKTVYRYREAEIIFGVVAKDKQVIQVELSSWHL